MCQPPPSHPQSVVEKGLAKEGTTRLALGREAFTERVWAWRREYGGFITEQVWMPRSPSVWVYPLVLGVSSGTPETDYCGLSLSG